MDNIENKKQSFILRYSENPLSLAIQASVQHNKLYSDECTELSKSIIRTVWEEQLEIIAEKYKVFQTMQTYMDDVLYLQSYMNDRFSSLFCNDGFKISHAQKSISLYLKHLWCRGQIDNYPACPIDRTILNKIYSKNVPSWTSMNSINELFVYLGMIQEDAQNQGLTISEWELMVF